MASSGGTCSRANFRINSAHRQRWRWRSSSNSFSFSAVSNIVTLSRSGQIDFIRSHIIVNELCHLPSSLMHCRSFAEALVHAHMSFGSTFRASEHVFSVGADCCGHCLVRIPVRDGKRGAKLRHGKRAALWPPRMHSDRDDSHRCAAELSSCTVNSVPRTVCVRRCGCSLQRQLPRRGRSAVFPSQCGYGLAHSAPRPRCTEIGALWRTRNEPRLLRSLAGRTRTARCRQTGVCEDRKGSALLTAGSFVR